MFLYTLAKTDCIESLSYLLFLNSLKQKNREMTTLD